jgi:flagellin-specific chaperone FliS
MERGGQIAANLRSLYFFLHRHLNDAARETSAPKIRQAIDLVMELRGAFASAAKKAA